MVTAARAKQVLQTAAHAPSRGHAPNARPVAKRTMSVASSEVTARQVTVLVGQGSLIACAILAALVAGILLYQHPVQSRMAAITGAEGAPHPPVSGTTTYYRDRGDGTVLVMEIDRDGARVKGTVNRADVPMLQEQQRKSRKWDEEAISGQSRLNALGSAFR